MKISVVTVCFNAQDKIETTINSVLSQTYNNIEYIVIDGGSTDSTPGIIDKYREKIAIFLSEKDNGIYDGMNKAINRASGDFLIFMNAGDSFYYPESLEQAVKAIGNSKAGIFYGDINVIELNGAGWTKTFRNTDKITLVSNCLCHQAVLYRKEVFDKIGSYDRNYTICADHELNLRALIKHKIRAKYVPVVICNFAMGGYSTNRDNIKNTSRQVHKISQKYYGKFGYRFMRFILHLLRNIQSGKTRDKVRKFITLALGLRL